jgi:hypothetical protein
MHRLCNAPAPSALLDSNASTANKYMRFQFHSNNGETETNLCSKKVMFIGSEYCVKSSFHKRTGKQA